MAPTLTGSWEPPKGFDHSPETARTGERVAAHYRREARYVVDQPVLVYTERAAESMRAAHVRDISTRGMQLLVEEPFPSGPQIRIRWNSHEVKGRILYQHKYDSEHYRIGVELANSCETLLIEILASHAKELRRTRSLLEQQTAALERAAGLLDLVSEALIVTSMEGTILLWNKGAERLYGWTPEEALGCQLNGLAGAVSTLPATRRRRKDGGVVVVASQSLMQPASQAGPAVRVYLETPIGDRRESAPSGIVKNLSAGEIEGRKAPLG